MEVPTSEFEAVPAPEGVVETQTGTDELVAQAQAEIAAARTAYNEAILGVIVVDKNCEGGVQPEVDSQICSCEKRIAVAQEAYDSILFQSMSSMSTQA